MDISVLKEKLHASYALSELEELTRTDSSIQFRAINSWATASAHCEMFTQPVDEATKEELMAQRSGLAWIAHRAHDLQDFDFTADNHLFVLRKNIEGSTLAELIAGRSQWGQPFTFEEVNHLLGPVAEAIDQLHTAQRADYVAGSINPDSLKVSKTEGTATVVLTGVGPKVPRQESATVEDNEQAFTRLIQDMTGQPVTQEVRDASNNLSELLNRFAFPHKYRENAPQQFFPPTNPGMPAVQSQPAEPAQEQTPVATSAPASEPKKKRGAMPWVAGIAGILAIAAAGGGAYWWFADGQYDEWSGEAAEIARDFDGVVGEKDGVAGWAGLNCASQDPDEGTEAKIRCADQSLGLTIEKYASESDRDEALPNEDHAIIGTEECRIASYELAGQDPPAFYLAPQSDNTEYLLTINGEDAEEQRMTLPICD